MFASANTAHFTLDIPGLSHDFKVLAFQAREAISQCYRIQLELVSDRSDHDLEALLQHNAWLGFHNSDGNSSGHLGCSVKQVYEVKQLDSDYFSED